MTLMNTGELKKIGANWDMKWLGPLDMTLFAHNSLTASHSICIQSCHSSQGTSQNVAKEPTLIWGRMAWYWCAAVSWMGTLCNSPVRTHGIQYFYLLHPTDIPYVSWQPWATHTTVPSGIGNGSSERTGGSWIGKISTWGVQDTVWYCEKVNPVRHAAHLIRAAASNIRRYDEIGIVWYGMRAPWRYKEWLLLDYR